MTKTTTTLLILAALVVAGGILYTLTPRPEVDLTSRPPAGGARETSEVVDNTIPFPPVGMVQVTLKTNKGDIDLVLDGAAAPKTTENFVKLARDDFYDGVIFHRVIEGFMIQGGDPTGTGTGGPGYQFADEINQRKLVRGSLAMANAGPDTNGSQFFIVTASAVPHLDGLHTNFGQAANEASMAVVQAISEVQTDANDKPVETVAIEDVVVHNAEKLSPALQVE